MRFPCLSLGCVVLAALTLPSPAAGPPIESPGLPGPCPEDGIATEKCGPNAPPVPHFAVVNGVLHDNGDDDGWADSRETVQMRLTILNRMGVDLTGITARLYTDDPRIVCILDPVIEIADLAVLEQRLTSEGFTFLVAEVERVDVAQDLSVEFSVVVTVDQNETPLDPHALILDLNLDAVGGAGPTTFFEGFESGFGAFTTMHLDESLNPPDSDLDNYAAGVANAEGHRCQYSDPDWEGSSSNGNSQGEQCFPNANGAEDAFWFHVISERSFGGAAAMHWGTEASLPGDYTTPTAQLEAIATVQPINFAGDKVCEIDSTIGCDSDLECPPGQACLPTPSTLSFKQQISLVDHRTW